MPLVTRVPSPTEIEAELKRSFNEDKYVKKLTLLMFNAFNASLTVDQKKTIIEEYNKGGEPIQGIESIRTWPVTRVKDMKRLLSLMIEHAKETIKVEQAPGTVNQQSTVDEALKGHLITYGEKLGPLVKIAVAQEDFKPYVACVFKGSKTTEQDFHISTTSTVIENLHKCVGVLEAIPETYKYYVQEEHMGVDWGWAACADPTQKTFTYPLAVYKEAEGRQPQLGDRLAEILIHESSHIALGTNDAAYRDMHNFRTLETFQRLTVADYYSTLIRAYAKKDKTEYINLGNLADPLQCSINVTAAKQILNYASIQAANLYSTTTRNQNRGVARPLADEWAEELRLPYAQRAKGFGLVNLFRRSDITALDLARITNLVGVCRLASNLDIPNDGSVSPKSDIDFIILKCIELTKVKLARGDDRTLKMIKYLAKEYFKKREYGSQHDAIKEYLNLR